MTTNEALKNAQNVINQRRQKAEITCENNLRALRSHPAYATCERNLRQAQVAHALCQGESKQKAQEAVEKYTAELDGLTKSYGFGAKDLQPHYSCTNCNDTGYVDGKRCQCLQKEFLAQLFAGSNIADKNFTFAGSTANGKHNKAVYREAEKICETNQNVLLCGQTGTGKTYLLSACANKCVTLGKSVLFVTAYNLNNQFLDAHLAPLAQKRAYLDALTDVDVLVIDDLGTETIYKNVTAEYLFDVINERETLGKQTMISTNLSLADIRERYDERIFSRLVNQKRTFVAMLDNADNRLTK